jgi:hypothetical protein
MAEFVVLCRHFMEGLRETTKYFSQDTWFPVRESNWAFLIQKPYRLRQLARFIWQLYKLISK